MKIDRVYSVIYIYTIRLVQVETWHTRSRKPMFLKNSTYFHCNEDFLYKLIKRRVFNQKKLTIMCMCKESIVDGTSS